MLQSHHVKDQLMFVITDFISCLSHCSLLDLKFCVKQNGDFYFFFRISGNKMHFCPGPLSRCLLLCDCPHFTSIFSSSKPFIPPQVLPIPVACETFTSVFFSLLSSWGLPGRWDRQLRCSHSSWSCPACSHSNRCAGLFHREKEKHGQRLPVFLV